MADLPFDAVVIERGTEKLRLTAAEFLRLPLAERVQVILERRVEFFQGTGTVERSVGLRALMGGGLGPGGA